MPCRICNENKTRENMISSSRCIECFNRYWEVKDPSRVYKPKPIKKKKETFEERVKRKERNEFLEKKWKGPRA